MFITFVGSLRVTLIVSIRSHTQSWHPSLLNVFIVLVVSPCADHFKPRHFSYFLGTWFVFKVLGTVCCEG